MSTNDPTHFAIDFPTWLSVYDCKGNYVGAVSANGVQVPYLMMRVGHLFHHDVAIPLSAVARTDAHGVYLNRTRQDIRDLTMGGWSSLGDVNLNTGALASALAGETTTSPEHESPEEDPAS